MNVLTNFELYDYVLRVDGKLTSTVVSLGIHEAKQINYAFGLNRSLKRYVRVSELSAISTSSESILITPPKG